MAAAVLALQVDKKELDDLDKKVGELKRAFQTEEPALKDIRDFVLPYRGKFSGEKADKDGQRKDKNISNGEAVLALRTLAAGLQSGVTSPARPWFKLATSDPTEDSEEVRIYLEDTQKRMELVCAQSNFYNSIHALYGELAGFGTSAMMIEEDFDSIIRCRTMTAGEYWIGLNDCLRVDKMARQLDMTARQLLGAFGLEALPEQIRQQVREDREEKPKYKVYHLIEPNPRHNPARYAAARRAVPTVYRSVYWLEGYKDQPLKVQGYHEKPFIAPRWDVVSDAIYGRSPAWECLGLVKSTNVIESDFLRGLALQTRPPMLAPDGIRDVDIAPGGMTYYTEGSTGNANQRVLPLLEVQANLAAATQKVTINEHKINQFFYADLFAMLSQYQGPKMTAQEVIERHEEKLLILGPVLERLYAEALSEFIERLYGIMYRNGLLMEVPEELEGQNIKIEYVSILAQAQRMVRRTSITDILGFVGNIAALNPDVLERIDFQEAVKQFGDYSGTPPGIIYGDEVFEEKMKAKREQEEQMMQAAQAAQVGGMVNQAADTAKTLSEADMSGANALTDISGQLGQALGGVPGG